MDVKHARNADPTLERPSSGGSCRSTADAGPSIEELLATPHPANANHFFVVSVNLAARHCNGNTRGAVSSKSSSRGPSARTARFCTGALSVRTAAWSADDGRSRVGSNALQERVSQLW